MRVADLFTDPTLRLSLGTPSGAARLDHEISRCAPAEYLDPTPFLDEHVLLLTSGIGMNFTEPRIWDAYVERLARVPIAAIAFSVGKAHPSLPHGLVTACTKYDVPLLEVPATVPMLKIFQYVESVLQAERYDIQERGWALADECARLANQGAEVSSLLAVVHAALRTPVAVYDGYGSLLARYPTSVHWRTGSERHEQPSTMTVPLPMGLRNPCQLAVRLNAPARELESLLAPVASILALQINRSVVVDASSHQEVQRFASQCLAWSEATRADVLRSFRDLGLSNQAETAVLIADMRGEHSAAAWQLRVRLHDSFHDVRVAEFEDRLLALVQFPRDTFEAASDHLLGVQPVVPLVLCAPTRTIDELRIAVVHSFDLVRRVQAPRLAPALGLSAIVAAAAGRGARESAVRFLSPLVEHDEQRTTTLLPTLSTWLRNDAQPSRTCEELFIHRNSLAYRLRRIEEVLNVSLDTLEGRATCLMALRLVEIEPH